MLFILGEGFEARLRENLDAGETGLLSAARAPGTYTVYCPVGAHSDQGMKTTITVTEAGASTRAGNGAPAP